MTYRASLTDALAAIVRDQIRQQGHSINGLAEKTGIPFSTLRRRVMGKTPFTTAELDALAAELQTSIEDLLAAAHTARQVPAA